MIVSSPLFLVLLIFSPLFAGILDKSIRLCWNQSAQRNVSPSDLDIDLNWVDLACQDLSHAAVEGLSFPSYKIFSIVGRCWRLPAWHAVFSVSVWQRALARSKLFATNSRTSWIVQLNECWWWWRLGLKMKNGKWLNNQLIKADLKNLNCGICRVNSLEVFSSHIDRQNPCHPKMNQQLSCLGCQKNTFEDHSNDLEWGNAEND